MPPSGPEYAFQRRICDLAGLLGWRWTHARQSYTKNGRPLTSIEGHKGWPDVTFSHPTHGVTAVVEFKADGKYPTSDQRAWLDTLARTAVNARPWFRVFVWRPNDNTFAQAFLADPFDEEDGSGR